MSVKEKSKFEDLFIDEVIHLLKSLKNNLLQLKENPHKYDSIQGVYIVMHTIKGICSINGFKSIENLMHQAEKVYDPIRKGYLLLSEEILDHTFLINDLLYGQIMRGKVRDNEISIMQFELLNWCDSVADSVQLRSYFYVNDYSNDLFTYNVIFNARNEIEDERINIFYAIKKLAAIGELKSINLLPIIGDEEERWSIFVVGCINQQEIEEALSQVNKYCIIRKVSDSDIFDNDKGVEWKLDVKERRYTEKNRSQTK